MEDCKKKLKEKLELKKNELKAICKDAKFAEALLNDIVSLSKQIAIKPSIVNVEYTEDTQMIDYSGYKLYKNNQAVVYQQTGMKLILEPTLGVYHFPYGALFDVKSNWDNATQEEKDGYDSLLLPSVIVPQTVTWAFQRPQFLAKLESLIYNELNSMVDEATNEDKLPEEDVIANEEFKDRIMLAEQIKEEIAND